MLFSQKTIYNMKHCSRYLFLITLLSVPWVVGHLSSIYLSVDFLWIYSGSSCSTILLALLLHIRFEKNLKLKFIPLLKNKLKKLGITDPESFEKAVQEYHIKYQRHTQALQSVQNAYQVAQHQLSEMEQQSTRNAEELRTLHITYNTLSQEYTQSQEEHVLLQKALQETLTKKEVLLEEYSRTISEQRDLLEKKQSYISQLEHKVHTLMQEIKTILDMEEGVQQPSTPYSFELPNEYVHPSTATLDLSIQLQTYVERIENFAGITTPQSGGNKPIFENYALDLRRLFEYLREETRCGVLVYSPSHQRPLFVNHFVRFTLGWSPEKFMKSFHSLLIGHQKWIELIKTIRPGSEYKINLTFKSKEGKELMFQCCTKCITQGPFIDQIIGIFVEKN